MPAYISCSTLRLRCCSSTGIARVAPDPSVREVSTGSRALHVLIVKADWFGCVWHFSMSGCDVRRMLHGRLWRDQDIRLPMVGSLGSVAPSSVGTTTAGAAEMFPSLVHSTSRPRTANSSFSLILYTMALTACLMACLMTPSARTNERSQKLGRTHQAGEFLDENEHIERFNDYIDSYKLPHEEQRLPASAYYGRGAKDL